MEKAQGSLAKCPEYDKRGHRFDREGSVVDGVAPPYSGLAGDALVRTSTAIALGEAQRLRGE